MDSVSESEKKALFELMPYFQRESVVFDVGSNKGYWADLLIHNVGKIVLFEPNDRLLTYTMVKYDYLKNVSYCDKAVCNSNDKIVNLNYFINENNGLSSLYDRPEFKDLPVQKKNVVTITLDKYSKSFGIDKIDFIKIDVEGAEFEVIQGALNLFKENRVRFVQFEYGSHWQLNGIKLNDIIEFVGRFGYKVWSYLKGFNEVTSYKDDYEAQNFYIFKPFVMDFGIGVRDIKEQFEFIFQVGCGDGIITRDICQTMIKKGGRIICYSPSDKELFLRNTRGYPVELNEDPFNEPDFTHYRFGLILVHEKFKTKFEWCARLLKGDGQIKLIQVC